MLQLCIYVRLHRAKKCSKITMLGQKSNGGKNKRINTGANWEQVGTGKKLKRLKMTYFRVVHVIRSDDSP